MFKKQGLDEGLIIKDRVNEGYVVGYVVSTLDFYAVSPGSIPGLNMTGLDFSIIGIPFSERVILRQVKSSWISKRIE